MKKLILDASKFNLMVERMENRYTLEETKIKERNLILEGFPKGIIGDILGGIGKTADEIETALKSVGIRLGSVEGQNFLKGLNFFNDPPINFRNWNDFDMSSFKSTLKKLNPAKTTDAILDKLDSIVDVSKEMEKAGNPVSNLIQTLDVNGFGLEEAERILDDTLSAYPDMFKNSDIQPVNGSKVFKEGDSVGNFVRRTIIKSNGQFVDGVPKRTQNRIVGEYLKDGGKQGDIEVKGGPEDGEEILVGPDGESIIIDGPGKGKKPPMGWKKFLWNATGIPLWWKLVAKGDFVSLKNADGVLGKIGGGAINFLKFKWKLTKGLLIPFPPLLYGWLGNCIYKNYFADIDDIEIMKDGKTAKYKPSLSECFGNWEVDTNGNTVNEVGFNVFETLPIVSLIQYGIVPSAKEFVGEKFINYLTVAENKVNGVLNSMFEGKSLPELLNMTCDKETIKILKDYYIAELKNTDFGFFGLLLEYVPGIDSLPDLESKLGSEDSDKALEIFGNFENIKKWQEKTYQELEKYIPETEKKEKYNISDLMEAKCQVFRTNAIIISIRNMNGKISEFPTTANGPGKNTNGSLCDNLKFWEELSTPAGGSQWDSETCIEHTEQITNINYLIKNTEGYSSYENLTNKTLLDPEIWEQSCKNLNDVHEGSPSVAEWICEQDPNQEFGDIELEVELEVEEVPVEVNVYYYKWQKYTEKDRVITTANSIIDTINQTAALKGEYLIKPNEEGSGVTENEYGVLEYDLCNPNVQKVWIDDYWCTPKRITKEGNDSGKQTSDCISDFKEYLREKNIC